MALHESGEDYLEAILVLRQEHGIVRSIDVAQYLGFSKPSVGRLELTPEGEKNAQRVYERHQLLTDWLIRLGVSPEVAAADACRMEHDMSAETFACLKRHAIQMDT